MTNKLFLTKRIIIIAIALLGTIFMLFQITSCTPKGIKIDSTTFPDQNLKQYLLDLYPYGKDKTLTDEEINSIIEIDISNKKIKQVNGIEIFTNLKKLKCNNNQLSSIDISTFENLTYLDCSNNKLTELNISSNSALQTLYCYDNILSNIEISNNNNLTTLSCENNQLTELDISNIPKLDWLNCSNNQISSLTIENNTKLSHLFCYSNNITNIDFSKNEMLLYFNSDFGEFDLGTELDLSTEDDGNGITSYPPRLYTFVEDFTLMIKYLNNQANGNFKFQNYEYTKAKTKEEALKYFDGLITSTFGPKTGNEYGLTGFVENGKIEKLVVSLPFGIKSLSYVEKTAMYVILGLPAFLYNSEMKNLKDITNLMETILKHPTSSDEYSLSKNAIEQQKLTYICGENVSYKLSIQKNSTLFTIEYNK